MLPISSPSCTASRVGLTPSENIQNKSKNSYKKAPRHRTHKVAPNKVLKIRVYPEAELHKTWKQWLAASRYCYNQAISMLKSNPKLSAYSLRNAVMNSDLPDWVKSCPNHPRENAIFDAHDAWRHAASRQGTASYRSCRQPVQAIKFHISNFKAGMWYPGLVKKLTFKASEVIPTNCEYATQLVRDRQRWFAIFPTYVEKSPVKSSKVIALDPGVRTFLTGYDSESILEFGSADIGRIQRLCSHLDKLMKSAAASCRKQKRRMYKAASRIRIRIRHLIDESHKQIANYLTTNYKVIFLPTFETSQMVVKSKRKLNTKTARAMLTWGHYRFERHLKQVAIRRGVVVVDVNESYTSKTCTACGFVHEKLGGSKLFKCPSCGHKHDRDWGGARNIMLRALRDGSFALNMSVEGIAIASDVFVHICSA
ncbi:MAG TPA: transposase [Oculatellaceae cyanobacterium]